MDNSYVIVHFLKIILTLAIYSLRFTIVAGSMDAGSLAALRCIQSRALKLLRMYHQPNKRFLLLFISEKLKKTDTHYI